MNTFKSVSGSDENIYYNADQSKNHILGLLVGNMSRILNRLNYSNKNIFNFLPSYENEKTDMEYS